MAQKVKDKITGFKGIVAGIAQTLSGWHIGVILPEVKKDKTLHDANWFHDERIEVVEKKPVRKSGTETTSRPGGPQDDFNSSERKL